MLGIGGYVLRAHDPTALGAGTDHLGSPAQGALLNLRVRDLDAMLARLLAAGADVDGQTQELVRVGRLGCVTDPEGNRGELWQPSRPAPA